MKKGIMFLVLLLTLMLSSCGTTPHTHNFKETDKKTEAILGKDGEKLFKCDCGEEKREVIHYYEWFECVNCQQKDLLREEIKEAFYNKFSTNNSVEDVDLFKKNIELNYYYGEYNGCYVINILNHSHYEKEWLAENESLENETLKDLSVYKEGEFYSLSKALELNLITKEDIKKVMEKDKLYYPQKYYQFTEGEKAYLKEITGYSKISDAMYRGKYNDVYIICSGAGVSGLYKETIDNVVIFYPNGARFQVIYNDNIYTLKEAFTNSILTIEEINKISLSSIKPENWKTYRAEELD